MDDRFTNIEQELGIHSPSAEMPLALSWLGEQLPKVFIKRDDQLHPVISGNKWRKLKYAINDILLRQDTHVMSFGGGYSNHLHALGYCCQKLGLNFSAIVRGNYEQNLTPMLRDLIAWGCHIQYVDKKTYQRRTEAAYLTQLAQTHKARIIPEGGSHHFALKGVAEIIEELQQEYDYILCPVGSAGTLAGLVRATCNTTSRILGISVLKGQGYLEQLTIELYPQAREQDHWQINHQYHFGGYAKSTDELTGFCQTFSEQTGVAVEPVYSGKLAYALCQMIKAGNFSGSDKILMLHTGGLQGAR